MIFTAFWLDGTKSTLEGNDITHAFNNAGIGAGAIPALDFHMEGDSEDYIFDKETHRWTWTEEKKKELGIA